MVSALKQNERQRGRSKKLVEQVEAPSSTSESTLSRKRRGKATPMTSTPLVSSHAASTVPPASRASSTINTQEHMETDHVDPPVTYAVSLPENGGCYAVVPGSHHVIETTPSELGTFAHMSSDEIEARQRFAMQTQMEMYSHFVAYQQALRAATGVESSNISVEAPPYAAVLGPEASTCVPPPLGGSHDVHHGVQVPAVHTGGFGYDDIKTPSAAEDGAGGLVASTQMCQPSNPSEDALSPSGEAVARASAQATLDLGLDDVGQLPFPTPPTCQDDGHAIAAYTQDVERFLAAQEAVLQEKTYVRKLPLQKQGAFLARKQELVTQLARHPGSYPASPSAPPQRIDHVGRRHSTCDARTHDVVVSSHAMPVTHHHHHLPDPPKEERCHSETFVQHLFKRLGGRQPSVGCSRDAVLGCLHLSAHPQR